MFIIPSTGCLEFRSTLSTLRRPPHPIRRVDSLSARFGGRDAKVLSAQPDMALHASEPLTTTQLVEGAHSPHFVSDEKPTATGAGDSGSLTAVTRTVMPTSTKHSLVLEDVIRLLCLSIPLAAQNVFGYSLNTISDACIGRLGPAALSSSTMANSFFSIMGISIVWGGAAGMETLCGQAHGASNKRLMRLVLLRSIIICWLIAVPLVLLWSSAEAIMLAVGQSPAIAAQGSVYLQALGPSVFLYILTECLQTFLVTQNILQPTVWAKGITTVLGPLYYYGLIFHCNMGLIGAAYAYTLCKLTTAVILGAWIWVKRTEVFPISAPSIESVTEAQATASTTDSTVATAVFQHNTSNTNLPFVEQQSQSSAVPGPPAAQHQLQTDELPAVGLRRRKAQPMPQSHLQQRLHSVATDVLQLFPLRSRAAMLDAAQQLDAYVEKLLALTRMAGKSLVEALDPTGSWEYLKFCAPAALMTCLEWWAYEILVIMAGWLPDSETSVCVLGISLTLTGLVYMLPAAMGTAASTRVSNALGAGDAKGAKRNYVAAIVAVVGIQALLLSSLLPFAKQIATFFCQDTAVATLTASLLPLIACNTVGDALHCVLNGVFRACGRQALGARIHLLGYWAVGLPLAYLLGFKAGLGVKGLLAAIGLSSFAQALVIMHLISRWDWQEEVARSEQLLSSFDDGGATAESNTAPGYISMPDSHKDQRLVATGHHTDTAPVPAF